MALWDWRGREFQGIPEGDAIRNNVESWHKRITAAERLDQAIPKTGLTLTARHVETGIPDLGGQRDSALGKRLLRNLKAIVENRLSPSKETADHPMS